MITSNQLIAQDLVPFHKNCLHRVIFAWKKKLVGFCRWQDERDCERKSTAGTSGGKAAYVERAVHTNGITGWRGIYSRSHGSMHFFFFEENTGACLVGTGCPWARFLPSMRPSLRSQNCHFALRTFFLRENWFDDTEKNRVRGKYHWKTSDV